MYRSVIRPVLFSIDPERAHHLVFALLRFFLKLPGVRGMFQGAQRDDPGLKRKLFGITFNNPVGLAAGLDKDARATDELAALGFGFIEIGTVTPEPQTGNDKPRLFRLPADRALINRMGFNNEGARAAAMRLRKRRSRVIIGGNIGKNKTTPNEKASEDYGACVEQLHDCVDYFVVNVSSPNTPGLRELQEKDPLKNLLQYVKTLTRSKPSPKPVLLKIAPDLEPQQLDDIVEIIKETGIDGLIATNTTVSREGLVSGADALARIGAGGLSGAPLRDRSNDVIRYMRQKLGTSFPIIGVGGIMTADDAVGKMRAGADLVQLYTGFIYEGPGLIRAIKRRLLANA